METLAHGYSSDSTQWEQSNKYQHDTVWMFFKNLPLLVLWAKVVSALNGLSSVEACFCYLMSSGHVAYLNMEQNDRLLMLAWLRVDGIHGAEKYSGVCDKAQSIIPGMEPEVQGWYEFNPLTILIHAIRRLRNTMLKPVSLWTPQRCEHLLMWI